jgi:hypothetical protein
VASGVERWLAFPVQRDNMEAVPDLDVIPGYSFTPDGGAVVVSYGGEIWRVPVAGGPAVKIPLSVDANIAVGPEVRFDYRIEDTPTTARQIRDPLTCLTTPGGVHRARPVHGGLPMARRGADHRRGEYFRPVPDRHAFVSSTGDAGRVRVSAAGGSATRVSTEPDSTSSRSTPDSQRIRHGSPARQGAGVDPFVADWGRSSSGSASGGSATASA